MDQTKNHILKVMDEKLQDIEKENKVFQLKFKQQEEEIDQKIGEIRRLLKNS